MANLKYRTDIDGLRAVSVACVVLFHTNELVPGGYVGVDVFFVISGFLITSLIQREVVEQRFSIQNFWVRRVRRILPASVACVLGTLILCGIVMLPSDFEAAARSAMASSVALANVYFWQDVGYFTGPADEKPFLHFWSLAVEEQFYLFYPLLLCGLAKWRRFSVARCLGLICILSFALSVWGVANKPNATFFLLPCRAWELLMGGLLAVLPTPMIGRKRSECLSLAGLLMIVGSACLFTKQTPFPGPAALLPCAGAVFVILANSAPGPTLVGKVLSWRPIVFVGLVSYSLYLWHWPVLALMRYTLIELNAANSTIAVTVSFLLAVLSWRYVEQPFRRARQPKPVDHGRGVAKPIRYGLLSVMFSLLVSGAIVAGDGLIWRFRDEIRPLIDDATWTGSYMERPRGNQDYPRIGDKTVSRDSFVVWGDSHAMMMSEVLDMAAQESGIAGQFICVAGVPPLPGVWRNLGSLPPRDEVEQVIEYILSAEIPNVVLVARWSAYAEGYGEGDLRFDERGKRFEEFIIGDENTKTYCPEDARRVLRNQLAALVDRFAAAGVQVWLVQQVPEQLGPTALPHLLEQHVGVSGGYFPTTYDQHLKRQTPTNSIMKSMKSHGAIMIETQPLCFDDQSRPILIRDDRACFRDNDHLSRYGARTLLLDRLTQLMNHISKATE